MPHYVLSIDDGETSTEEEFDNGIRAMCAFRKACRRDPFTAAVWAHEHGYRPRRVAFYEGDGKRPDKKTADKIDGYDRDDLGESPDY